MFISDRMSASLVTIEETTTVQRAADLLAEHKIHQLPVIRGKDRLVGIVTDRDVRSVHDPAEMAGPAAKIMTVNPVTVSPGEPLEEALLLLHRHRFGSLPVVTPPPAGGAGDEALPRLVGIITHTDILTALIDMLAVDQPGTRVEVELPESTPDRICGALHAIGSSGARIISLVVSGEPGAKRQRLYVRLSTIDPRPAIEALNEGGYRLANPSCRLL